MNDNELRRALGHLTRGIDDGQSHFFGGAYFESDLERHIHEIKWRLNRQKCYLIINVGGGNREMGHWLGLFLVGKKGYFLDSLAKNYGFYGGKLLNFITGLNLKILHRMRYRLQNDSSLTCGLYCLYFAREIQLHGVNNVLKNLFDFFFKNNWLANDRKIIRYCYTYFPMPSCQRTLCDWVSREECQLSVCSNL